jgi:hypothetical protein
MYATTNLRTACSTRGLIGQDKSNFSINEDGVARVYFKLDTYWHRAIEVKYLGKSSDDNSAEQKVCKYSSGSATVDGRILEDPPAGLYEVSVLAEGLVGNPHYMLDVLHPSIKIPLPQLNHACVVIQNLFRIHLRLLTHDHKLFALYYCSVVFEYREKTSDNSNEFQSVNRGGVFIDPTKTYEFRYYLLNANGKEKSGLSNVLSWGSLTDVIHLKIDKSDILFQQSKLKIGPLPTIPHDVTLVVTSKKKDQDHWKNLPFQILSNYVITTQSIEVDITFTLRITAHKQEDTKEYILFEEEVQSLKSSECYQGKPNEIAKFNNGVLHFRLKRLYEDVILCLDGKFQMAEYFTYYEEDWYGAVSDVYQKLTTNVGNYTIEQVSSTKFIVTLFEGELHRTATITKVSQSPIEYRLVVRSKEDKHIELRYDPVGNKILTPMDCMSFKNKQDVYSYCDKFSDLSIHCHS